MRLPIGRTSIILARSLRGRNGLLNLQAMSRVRLVLPKPRLGLVGRSDASTKIQQFKNFSAAQTPSVGRAWQDAAWAQIGERCERHQRLKTIKGVRPVTLDARVLSLVSS
jgi:hypothetical protein